MNEKFDYKIAHAYCRQFGVVIAIIWCISFISAMQDKSIILAQLSNLIGMMSIIVLGIQLKSFGLNIHPLSFLKALWMSIYTFFCAALITSVVQYIYLLRFDNGHLLSTFLEMLERPEYKELFNQLAGQEGINLMTNILQSPTQLTLQFFMMNIMIGLIFSIPTALTGKTRTEQKHKK